MLTEVKLMDVNGEPRIRKELPGPLRIGDPLKLRFRITRENKGRYEILEVIGVVFRVTTVAFDDSSGRTKQVIGIETAAGRPPVWRSVKRPEEASPPACWPPTSI